MGAKVSVNKRTVVHKGSTGIAMAFPDVCKTPAPPAPPVPIPYPNIAQSSDAAKTTKKVTCDGEGVCVKGSNFSRSSGDEAGSLNGMVSNKFMGKAEFANFSMDVKFEGKTVARLGDPMTQNGGQPNAVTPAEGQPPQPPAITPEQQAEACARVAKKHDPNKDPGELALECGMDPGHAKGIQDACSESGITATFRSTNPDCLKHILAGNPAKGCSVSAKTISAKTLASAPNGASVPAGLRGLVGSYDKAGNITGVARAKGPPLPLSKFRPPPPTDALTGDYDMHDIFSRSGSRVPPGAGEDGVMSRLNEAIGRGDAGPGTDMVRHGPQANYPDFAAENLKGGKPGLMVPDVGPNDPLLVFDGDGKVYKIENEQELRDLYTCKGEHPPESWNWKEEDWKKAHADGKLSEMPSSEFIKKREEVLSALV